MITREDPRYWGTPISANGTSRATGADRMQLERNETPSLAWTVLPDTRLEQIEALDDHIHVRLQCYLHLLVYVNGSELRLRRTTAPNQVTSGAAPQATEEAHPHLLAGIACTTKMEFETKGIGATWVQLAGASHLGKCFQMTHRLWEEVNKTDTSLESSGTGESGITLREFALECARMAADGMRPPSKAWADFLEAHAVACKGQTWAKGSWGELACERYTKIIKRYQKRLNQDGQAFVKLIAQSGEKDPNAPEYAVQLQFKVAKEICQWKRYALLIKSAQSANGNDNCFPEQVNAFLTALVQRERPSAAPLLAPKATTGPQGEYVVTLTKSKKYNAAVVEQVGRYGSLEVARQLDKKISPVKASGLKVLKKAPKQADRIVLSAAHAVVKGNLFADGDPDPSKLACFLCEPLLITHVPPSMRPEIRAERTRLQLRLSIERLFLEYSKTKSAQLATRIDQLVEVCGNKYGAKDTFLVRRQKDLEVIRKEKTVPVVHLVQKYQRAIEESEFALRELEVGGIPSRKPLLAPTSMFENDDALRVAKKILRHIGALPKP